MSRSLRINMVFLYVADLDRARRFYAETVGFGPPAVQTDDWVEFELDGGAHFALHRTTSAALDGCQPARNTVRFSIEVSDLRAACDGLRAAGVLFVRPPEKGPSFELAEFEDPEGNPVRLIQFDCPAPTA